MGVGQAQHLEHALDGAVLAAAAVQGVEDDVGRRRKLGDEPAEIARHIDAFHLVAQPLERRGAFASRYQRDLALGGPAAHQHGNAAAHRAASNGTPTRRISQSRATPLDARTRARTSSPSASRSAAVASPVLMRKLACFSETIAPPRLRPRQPAASISSQALRPGGLAKVEPPVRARMGWLSSRALWISFIRRAMASGSPFVPAKRAATKIQSSGRPQWR